MQIWKPTSQADIEADENILKKPIPIVDVVDHDAYTKGTLTLPRIGIGEKLFER
jgi:hypothetical protein